MTGAAPATVLVVDDDENVRNLALWILRRLGCRAVVVDRVEAAVDEFRQAFERGERFTAVVTDLSLPGGAGGSELLAELREIDPGVAVFVMSGDTDDPRMLDWAAHGFLGAIPKSRLHETLPRVLGSRLGSSPVEPGQPRS